MISLANFLKINFLQTSGLAFSRFGDGVLGKMQQYGRLFCLMVGYSVGLRNL